MDAEWRLARGQQTARPARAGDEFYCAAGSVRVQFIGGEVPVPARVLQAGGSLRAVTAGLFMAEAIAGGHGVIVRPAAEGDAAAAPQRKSLRLWGRRLLWGF